MSPARSDLNRLTGSCLDTLHGWSAPGEEQERLRLLYLQHLDAHPDDGWSRSCHPAHLTASSLICAPGAQQVLLTLHAKIGRWLQTGGHVEPSDPSLSAAAVREAQEESGLTGLTLDPVPLLLSRHLVSCGGEPTYHLDVQYLVISESVLAPVVGEESLDVRWYGASTLPDTDGSVHDLVRAASERLGWL